MGFRYVMYVVMPYNNDDDDDNGNGEAATNV